MSFEFNLGEEVEIDVSGEAGKVIGRAEYVNDGNNYLIRYLDRDKHAVESWWKEDALKSKL
ncbi:hypothetical protein [Burkholderia sp. TSV86]|uniref:hypothetical protein n=1 Tax=Burkholderia sp. TSV86 TaxID=1385594 RepID=UPI000751AFFE|nr:hypothetical protein [Burkholderia sp. TSV86]KVE34312.1 hypothetical protein WS68_09535 [Burkholderia sp. TSV86]